MFYASRKVLLFREWAQGAAIVVVVSASAGRHESVNLTFVSGVAANDVFHFLHSEPAAVQMDVQTATAVDPAPGVVQGGAAATEDAIQALKAALKKVSKDFDVK
jgi:hypothetical protein